VSSAATGASARALIRDLADWSDGADPEWIGEIPRRARADFERLGLPTRALEAWKYTDLEPLRRRDYRWVAPRAAAGQAAASDGGELPGLDAIRLSFVDGALDEQGSDLEALPRGVWVGSLRRAAALGLNWVAAHLCRHARPEEQALVALNSAHLVDGAAIHIAKNVLLERPIHVRFLSDRQGAHHPRLLFRAEAGSEATLIEDYRALGEPSRYYNNAVGELVLEANAALRHVRLEREGVEAHHTATVQIVQQENSRYSGFNISIGGALVRIDTNASLQGCGSRCELWGLYMAGGARHVDNHTCVDHAVAHCTSTETYKGILTDAARAVFNGRVLVRPDAQQTDARQRNPNLLLSPEARVDTKPELEIYADDVKCAHGATVGQLDPAALFYLRSRGLDETQARALLSRAFATEVLARIDLEPVANALAAALWRSEPASLEDPS